MKEVQDFGTLEVPGADLARIVSVKELLATPHLRIPIYQRPYKWSVKNVSQLLDDVQEHKEKSAYRLGTIVLHTHTDKKDGPVLDLVDGQQRTVTLGLLASALLQDQPDVLQKLAGSGESQALKPQFGNFRFSSPISKQNIHQNYQEIRRRVEAWDERTIRFFFEKCEVVLVVIEDLSEAFQFFDSQNARGRELDPHDLLKAFHLREMGHLPEKARMAAVQRWQDTDQQRLAQLFHEYLFRIRNWSKGRSARVFTKGDVHVFKGVSPNATVFFPYGRLYQIANAFVDDYQQHLHRQIDGQKLDFPFQIDQVVMNGQRFFEMIGHYLEVVETFRNPEALLDQCKPDGMAHRILVQLNTYEARERAGDKYVRTLFDCALLYYQDRFGSVELERAIEVFFVWAYKIRLELRSVQLASMDNHALQSVQIFRLIREALEPNDVLNVSLPLVENSDATKVDGLKDIFKSLRYYVS